MKKGITAGILALSILTGTAQAAGPAVLPREIAGGGPSGMLAIEDGGYLLTDVFQKVVWKVSAEGEVTKLAGQIGVADLSGEPIGRYEDGTLDTAFFLEPWDITPFLEGYAVSDTKAHVLRYIDEKGVYTLGGTGESGYKDANGIKAAFARPTGLATDDKGNLYISDTDNGMIRCMDDEGYVTTVCSGLHDPTGLSWVDGDLYVAETGANRIVRVNGMNRSVLVGGEEGNTDGRAAQAKLRAPRDVIVGPEGELYIADTGNGSVRKLENGQLTTILDMAQLGYATLQPQGLMLYQGKLLVTDPFASVVLEIETEQPDFLDVGPDSWCYEGVTRARDLRLTGGTGDGKFSPDRLMTRGQFVTMLGNLQKRLDGDLVIDGEMSFPDVPEEFWCAKSVRWAADQGITRGSNDGNFHPNQALTRQQLVTFLFKFAQMSGAPTDRQTELTAFTDADSVAAYAQEPMAWAVANGIIQGGEDGRLNPTGQAIRAHGVVILVRFMDWLQR